MKTRIITFLLVIITTVVLGQVSIIDCITENSDLPPIDNGANISNDPNLFLTGDPLVLNVYYWQVRGPNGDYGGQTFSQAKALENIAYLNLYYNQYNIFFKYRGYDGFDTPADLPLKEYQYNELLQKFECVETNGIDPNGYGFVGRCQAGDLFTYATNNGYFKSDAINVYVPYGSEFGGIIRGSRQTILKINKLTNPVVLHEFAHNMGLHHTRSFSYDHNVEGSEESERATRDPNGPYYYNADSAADGLVATASHLLFYDKVCGDGQNPACYPNILYPSCEYDQQSLVVDYDGHLIAPHIQHGDVINIMSAAYMCTELFFFPAQINYMRSKIVDPNYSIKYARTDVPALYEPYAGNYSDPTVVGLSQPLFQPGFDYTFLSCGPQGNYPLPSDHSDTSFTYIEGGLWWYGFDKNIPVDYFYSIKHRDRFAIRIAQIEQQPRKCWNTGQGAIGGTLVKFNDGVLNSNVTITQQDSTTINNLQYINQLQPGLYNVIKNFETGETQENIILKENN